MLNKYQHINEIKNTQPAKINSILPGMILKFKYKSLNPTKQITDENPLILFLYFNSEYGLLEGLNLNYVNKFKFKNLFKTFSKTTFVSTQEEEVSPYLVENFTLVSLPPVSQVQRPKSRSEAKKEMKMVYGKIIGPKFSNIYRSYSLSGIKTLKAVNLKDY